VGGQNLKFLSDRKEDQFSRKAANRKENKGSSGSDSLKGRPSAALMKVSRENAWYRKSRRVGRTEKPKEQRGRINFCRTPACAQRRKEGELDGRRRKRAARSFRPPQKEKVPVLHLGEMRIRRGGGKHALKRWYNRNCFWVVDLSEVMGGAGRDFVKIDACSSKGLIPRQWEFTRTGENLKPGFQKWRIHHR